MLFFRQLQRLIRGSLWWKLSFMVGGGCAKPFCIHPNLVNLRLSWGCDNSKIREVITAPFRLNKVKAEIWKNLRNFFVFLALNFLKISQNMSFERKYCNFDLKNIENQGIFTIFRLIPPNFLIRDFHFSLKNFFSANLRLTLLYKRSVLHTFLKSFKH